MKGERGQAVVEYCLVVSLICMVAIVALASSGTDISSLLRKIAGEL